MTNEEQTILVKEEQIEQQILVDSELGEKSVTVERESQEQPITVTGEHQEQVVPVLAAGQERMVDVEQEAIRIGTEGDFMPCVDLGELDIEDYDWDFWAYLDDKTESGFYHIYEIQDGFDYFFRVERAGSVCYQEWWYAEEGSLMRMCRNGWQNGDTFDWGDSTEWITSENAYSSFALKGQTYTKQEVNNLLSNKVDNSAFIRKFGTKN